MGTLVLRDVLATLDQREGDDMLFVPAGVRTEDVNLDTPVVMVRFDPGTPRVVPPGTRYFLEVESLCGLRDGGAAHYRRPMTPEELAWSAVQYALYDIPRYP